MASARERPVAVVPLAALRHDAGVEDDVAQHRDVLDRRHVDAQRQDHVDDLLEVGLLLERDEVRHRCGRALHERDAHLRDDAQVGLGEHPVRVRTEAVGEQLPRVRSGQRAHAGAHDLALRQDHLEARLPQEVVTVGRVADAAVERVADDAAPPEVGRVEHEDGVCRLQVLVEVEVRDAGLQQGIAVLLVDLQDAVHPLAHVDDDRAGQPWRRAAVAVVLARGDRRQRDAVTVGDPHDLLDLLGAPGSDDGGREELIVAEHRIGVAVGLQPGRVVDDVLPADGTAKLAERVVERSPRRRRGEGRST